MCACTRAVLGLHCFNKSPNQPHTRTDDNKNPSQPKTVPVILAHRTVYYKQHAARFFQPSAYGLATWLVWIGYVAMDVLTFGSLVYFLVGFTPAANHVLVAAALLFAGGLAMQQLFRSVCYLVPDTLSAIATMGGLIMLFSMCVRACVWVLV